MLPSHIRRWLATCCLGLFVSLVASQTAGATPPPDDICQVVTDDCLTVELLDIRESANGTTTYDVRIIYNCNRGLSFAALELPPGVSAVSFTTGGLISRVENPGGTGGPNNPAYRNLRFEFGGDIKNGDAVELSFTLPEGGDYTDGLRIRTKGGRALQNVTLDPTTCTDVCESDEGPPIIEYTIVGEDDATFIEVRVTDDTALESVSFEEVGTSNLEEDEGARVFTPGEPTAFFKFRILDLQRDTRLKGQATDACGNVLCPTDETNDGPTLTPTLIVIDDDVAGRFEPYSNFANPKAAKEAGYDRFGNLLEATDDTGIVRYETFARNNIAALQQPVPDCDTDGGCDLDPPQLTLEVVMRASTTSPSSFGFFVADECNVFVLDPPNPEFAARRTGAGGYVLSCPSFDGGALAAAESVEFGLDQNQPNPFSARSSVQFSLPDAGDVHLAVYDLLGRTVLVLADGAFEQGQHTVPLDAAALPAGMYTYRLTTQHGTAARQMVVVR